MKHYLFFIAFFWAFWSPAIHAQTTYEYEIPDPLPSPRDARNVYVGFEYKDWPSSVFDKVTLQLKDRSVLHNTVKFVFPDFSDLVAAGHKVLVSFNDGNPEEEISPGAVIEKTYPVNTSGSTVEKEIKIIIDDLNVSDEATLTLNPTNATSPGGTFVPPAMTMHFPFEPLVMEPPVAGAFPAGSIYNENTVGGADVYINYAASHNGKILKPLIFVDGIDFGSTELTYNGQVIRHGSTGWDIFVQGNDDGNSNSFDTDSPVFSGYPAALAELSAEPHNYDIIFVDFERGSDWIQKNGEVLIQVIKWVNEQKEINRQLGLCTVDNVVVGASMGGQVAKWALRTMEIRNIAHETHTYVSFDSPQRGAHIPLGVQSFAYLADITNQDKGSPTLWSRLNSPAARQMLLQHLSAEFAAGRVNMSQSADGVYCVGGFQLPETPTMDYTKTTEIRNQFKNEMEAIGYPSATFRNIAISCGSDNGEFQDFSSGDRLLSANLVALDVTCGAGEEFLMDGQVFASGGGPGADKTMLNYCPFEVACNEFTGRTRTLFKGALPYIVFSDDYPVPISYRFLEVIEAVNQPDFDRAPGCKRGDLMTIGQIVLDSEVPGIVNGDVAMDHKYTCFMPTISLLDVNVPMDDANFATPILWNDPNWASSNTPFDAVWASSDGNLRHVEMVTPMLTWLIGNEDNNYQGQLQLGELASIQAQNLPEPFVLQSGQTFNYGKKRTRVPETMIQNGAQMAVNLEGRTNFMTSNDPLSDKAKFEVYTGQECGDQVNVTVKNGGVLQIGDPNVSTKSGVFHVLEGSTVKVEAGGTLKISNASDLMIYPGASLILEPGSNVVLEDYSSRIAIKGTWVVNGGFNFSGLGFFDYAGKIEFGPNASRLRIIGAVQHHRFLRLQTDLKMPYDINLDFQKGGVEYWNGSTITLRGSSQVYGYGMKFSGDGTGFDIKGTGKISLSSCSFHSMTRPFEIIGFTGNNGGTNIDAVTVTNTSFISFENGAVLRDRNDVTFTNCNFYILDAIPTAPEYGVFSDNNSSIIFRNCTLDGYKLYDEVLIHYGSDPLAVTNIMTEGIRVQGGYICWLDGGSITGWDLGIANRRVTLEPEKEHQPANILLTNKATLRDCTAGVCLEGSQSHGVVIASCARFIDNKFGIAGQDITLMIDPALLNPSPLYEPLPNYFVRPGDMIGNNESRYLSVCYFEKPPGTAVSASNNFWGIHGTNNTIVAANSGQLVNAFDVRRSSFPACNGNFSNIGVTFTPVAGPRDCDAALLACGTTSGDCLHDCIVPIDGENSNTYRQQFMAGYDRIMAENWDDSRVRLQPLSDLWQSDMPEGTSDDCRTLVQAARSFVHGETQGRMSQSRSATQINGALSVQPNPATDRFLVILPNGLCQVTVFDIHGRQVVQATQAQASLEISSKGWPSGVYIVKIQSADGQIRAIKVVVE